MKKEEVVSSGVMTLVSILVLIGFTVAWYSADIGAATVIGMQMIAAQKESIIVALEEQGVDVSELAESGTYASIGLEELTNIETDKVAPGSYGKVTFYLRPIEIGIHSCDIVPQIWISQKAGETLTWYSGEEKGTSGETGGTVGGTDRKENTLENLYAITQEHFDFYCYSAETQEYYMINAENPFRVEWTPEESVAMDEKMVEIYWKWHYENPLSELSEEEKAALTEEELQQLIDEYDAEDTRMGNHITSMKFHFTFSAN